MAAIDALSVNRESLSRLNSILSESFYKDAIENSASYNTRLCMERKMRMPFLDAQTGVAQSDCALWMPKWQRMPGISQGQLYTYPAKRWHKKRRQYLMNNRYLTRYAKDADSSETAKPIPSKEHAPLSSPEVHQINVVENSAIRMELDTDSMDKVAEDSKDSWLRDIEDVSEPPDIGELDDGDSDYEEYEETYRKKKRKVVRNTRSRKKADKNDCPDDKPYSCEICGARYKTRPGLNYHYTHSHNNGSTDNTEEETSLPPPSKSSRPTGSASSSSSAGTPPDDSLAGQKNAPEKSISPSPYCDFCLGDNVENKKTRQAEELVSCSDCGRSAHPTCLQFTPNMTSSVKKYRWQCIECKSCGLCGTSDNDDQLLFCDDCDRGYHMYCLTPPLHEPPEGSWSCHLCIEEYHKK